MPHDLIALEDAYAWLLKAELDLRAARGDLGLSPPLLGDAAFHCQQAAEKALKAVLALHDKPFRKTHDLGELERAMRETEPSLAQVASAAVVLSDYAWEFRYPGDVLDPPAEEVDEALALASELVDAVRNVLAS
ncbi:MAG: HEPN domain-containing protein [Coriobacteriia bacterium]